MKSVESYFWSHFNWLRRKWRRIKIELNAETVSSILLKLYNFNARNFWFPQILWHCCQTSFAKLTQKQQNSLSIHLSRRGKCIFDELRWVCCNCPFIKNGHRKSFVVYNYIVDFKEGWSEFSGNLSEEMTITSITLKLCAIDRH